ncbi:MAG: excinuclease ABC subunit UvrC [Deltaproteobacteria bacterium]|nr:excinuclease ABC subunit UvrC [Deltaproteobacteria bacterium]
MTHATHSQYELQPERLRRVLPDSPGVYCFKDCSGRVIYVGKAKSLKKRVLSYFRPYKDFSSKTALMMKKACGLDFILTSTEKEAFILESSLIKKYMPRYNVILRDDKQYPCVKLDVNEDYPRLSIVRKIKKDGAVYFGPFSSASAVRSTHRAIDRLFKLRKCKNRGLPKRTRPCLNYQMGRCLGPCTYDISVSEYREIVQQVRLFLDGCNRELIVKLKEDMAKAADNLDFERAVGIRDQIMAIEKTIERQHVVSRRLEDQDIIGMSQKEDQYQVVSLFVRKGYVVGSRNNLFHDPGGSPSEVMEAFLKQYYSREGFIPGKIFVSEPIEDLVPVTEWLGDLAGKRVVIRKPIKGEKLRLVNMAIANAENLLAGHAESQEEELMNQVQLLLKLEKRPRFIEGLDISNFQGDMAVGTIASFVDGLPHKPGYRNYRIKGIESIDDYGMMTELVKRRIARGQLPDLFVVDGGKGHLSCVKSVVDGKTTANKTAVISIAKPDEKRQEKYDKIYLPGRKNPLNLRPDHPVLLLMMRIRDEAHRRAVSYHRKLRGQRLTESKLDRIPGIGPKRKKILLKHFGDLNAVAGASLNALLEVDGITPSLAERIFIFMSGKEG